MKKLLFVSILAIYIITCHVDNMFADFYVIPGVKKNYAPVEKSGQTTSYTSSDDGDLEKGVVWPDPRFVDNGDGTVTDNLTGLMWLENANCMGSTTGFDTDGTPNDGLVKWTRALDFIAALNLGTYSCGCTGNGVYDDWRLPNIKELLSLIDYSQVAPALQIDNIFDMPAQSFDYWSSTT
ncbi:MAG: DUF1566 domain-containing protein, partial [Deltaproteobacteria bacterium]|nr:DUF1566 domain-containing protein [Deltaproteobacteria bacterium]